MILVDGMKTSENIEIMRPMKQKAWGWPAAANFILGGMATGFYILCYLIEIIQENAFSVAQSAVCKLLPPVLICLAFLALTLEIGRPMRGHYLFYNLRSSWMSREALAGTVFVFSAVFDWFYPSLILRNLAVAAGLMFIVSQGFIVFNALAVTSWNIFLIPIFFSTSALVMGVGMMLLFAAINHMVPGSYLIAIGLGFVIIDFVVWLRYKRWHRDAIFREAAKVSRRSIIVIHTIGVAYLLQTTLLLLLLLMSIINVGVRFRPGITLFAGLAIVAGDVIQKIAVIIGAGYLRAVVATQSKCNTQNRNMPV